MANEVNINKFNNMAGDWNDSIPKINYDIACRLIEKLEIGSSDSILDVAAGTGILFSLLKDKELLKYTAIDISDNMVKEFLKYFPGTDVRCADFECDIKLDVEFDFIIIFNSIPHFSNLDMIFQNAGANLKKGGKFVIAHSKTREGLKQHHRNIGYVPPWEPIPSDETLVKLSQKYNFCNVIIEDKEYFYFCCEKN